VGAGGWPTPGNFCDDVVTKGPPKGYKCVSMAHASDAREAPINASENLIFNSVYKWFQNAPEGAFTAVTRVRIPSGTPTF